MKRKNFLQKIAIGAGGIVVAPYFISAQTKSPKVDPLSPEKVKEFIGAGDNNLVRLKELLVQMPPLLYATWDWGDGDSDVDNKVLKEIIKTQ